MKKYKLLIDSPHIPKGTIVEFDSNICSYSVVLGGIMKFTPQQVENRPEVWEEITEEEVNEYLPFQPKQGEDYWYVIPQISTVGSGLATDSDGRHNVFRTEKAAEYEKLRQESMNKRWKPDFEEDYYYYHFNNDFVCHPEWKESMDDIHNYLIGNVHKTELEALQWWKKYGEAWRVLL